MSLLPICKHNLKGDNSLVYNIHTEIFKKTKNCNNKNTVNIELRSIYMPHTQKKKTSRKNMALQHRNDTRRLQKPTESSKEIIAKLEVCVYSVSCSQILEVCHQVYRNSGGCTCSLMKACKGQEMKQKSVTCFTHI